MKILTGKKWREGFLDYYRGEKEYRIKVIAFKNLEKLRDIYFVRPKSLKLVLNYLLKFGFQVVVRKIRSRLSERHRNEKFVSLGIGRIIEPKGNGEFSVDEIVAFIAPFHPALLERLTLPEEFLIKTAGLKLPKLPERKIVYQSLKKNPSQNWWQEIKGWSIYSGIELSQSVLEKIKTGVFKYLKETDWNEAEYLPQSDDRISEIKESPKIKSSGKNVCLFGYGNYAKTQLLPNIKRFLNIVAVHEIDPTQIPLRFAGVKKWDTSPLIRENEKYEAFLIAGFHHTHVPLAISALNQNAYALIEKPVAVDEKQLKNLLTAVQKTKAGVFAGFHKRYSPFNKMIFEDFGIEIGAPIDYHCTVYEETQPKLYWYNWPNSKSPLLYNGCHWIDHFLYLNKFNKPKNFEASISKNKIINVSINLENGACFRMVFTGQDNSKIGIQDYVEIKTKDKNAKIANDSFYVSEWKNGIIRKRKINKADNYKIMYETIGKKIANNEQGDDLRSLKISTETVLLLENKLNAKI